MDGLDWIGLDGTDEWSPGWVKYREAYAANNKVKDCVKSRVRTFDQPFKCIYSVDQQIKKSKESNGMKFQPWLLLPPPPNLPQILETFSPFTNGLFSATST